MSTLRYNNTYELQKLPDVDGKWVYQVKLGPNGEERFKARYVAKGYSQVKDFCYKKHLLQQLK